jgi:hypothetical protein
MRHPLLVSAMVCFMSAAPALAQSYPAVILQKEVEVRSGPSKNFYPTMKLNQNDKVMVLRESKEAPGWLEIVPPWGSFSWVNNKNVKQIDARHAFVDCDLARPVAILPGSTLVNQPPNRESTKLTAGCQVIIVNPPLTLEGETWLPILPHPSEVRYIPAEAVKATPVVTPTKVETTNWARMPDNSVINNNPLYAQAEDAIKAGDINRAKTLLTQMYNSPGIDANQKQLAANRYASLPNGPSPTVPATTTSLSPGNNTPPTPTSLVSLKAPEWSTYGRLRDTKLLSENGQAVYSLEDGQGKVLTYITTPPGKSLQMYNGRTVAVYGPTMYRADVRMQYVVASHVAVP